MKRFSPTVLDTTAVTIVSNLLSVAGLRNALSISIRIRKLLLAEKNKRKKPSKIDDMASHWE